MGEGESLHLEELVRENENLREQRRAVGEVLRAVARSEGLQPVLDEIVAAAKRLCHGEHAQLYLADGDLFVDSRRVMTPPPATSTPKTIRTRTTGRRSSAG